MAGRKFEASDKKVQKMSREGLTEENLHSGERQIVSTRTRDAVPERIRDDGTTVQYGFDKNPYDTDVSSGSKRKQRSLHRASEAAVVESEQSASFSIGEPSERAAYSVDGYRTEMFSEDAESYKSLQALHSENDFETAKSDRTGLQESSDVRNSGTGRDIHGAALERVRQEPGRVTSDSDNQKQNRRKRQTRKMSEKIRSEAGPGNEVLHSMAESQPDFVPQPLGKIERPDLERGRMEATGTVTEPQDVSENHKLYAPETTETDSDGDVTAQPDISDGEKKISSQSARMSGVRERSAGGTVMQTAAETRCKRPKRQVKDYQRKASGSQVVDDLTADLDAAESVPQTVTARESEKPARDSAFRTESARQELRDSQLDDKNGGEEQLRPDKKSKETGRCRNRSWIRSGYQILESRKHQHPQGFRRALFRKKMTYQISARRSPASPKGSG
ncbi:MAG: hypothetical protein LUI10_01890 [Lachnospiraceae bacterium]|nr:hypothetical protein [Lachnospiraceae bacterium]